MVATVTIGEKNGVGGTYTDKTSGTIRMKNADNATVDSANAMLIPASGSDWSYEKWLRFKIGATGPAVQISNIKMYTDGGNGFGTGVSLWAKAVTAYATPAEGTSSASYENAFSYTSGLALSLDSGDGPWSAINTEFGKHAVLLLQVDSTAAQGSLTVETVTFSYDEI